MAAISRRGFLSSVVALAIPLVAARASDASPSMTPANSAATYQEWLARREVRLATLSIPQLVRETLAFYQTIRCGGLELGPGSDTLLYQWGVFDWGQGEHFEFDITRQFVAQRRPGDEGISQLHTTAYFEPTPELRRIRLANRWCGGVGQVEQFSAFIEASEAYKSVSRIAPQKVVVEWSLV